MFFFQKCKLDFRFCDPFDYLRTLFIYFIAIFVLLFSPDPLQIKEEQDAFNKESEMNEQQPSQELNEKSDNAKPATLARVKSESKDEFLPSINYGKFYF